MRKKTALVTGSLGNVGTYITRRLLDEGYHVVGVDNNDRAATLGKDGDTRDNAGLFEDEDYVHLNADITTIYWDTLFPYGFDAIVHAAAQVSHPRSIEIPMLDFKINALGTIKLLEYLRNRSPLASFIFLSTSKVYGENVNQYPIVEHDSRYDYDAGWSGRNNFNGVSERCSIDQTLHTPFGCSKLYADVVTQEYGRLYGLNTAVLRPNCMAGIHTKPTIYQRWEAFIMKKVLAGEKVEIFGFKGKQVRDIIHCSDVADAIYRMIERPPKKKGEVFNIGGGMYNSLSVLELLDRIKMFTGKYPEIINQPKREADWAIYTTDTSKLWREYPDWKLTVTITDILRELIEPMEKLVKEAKK